MISSPHSNRLRTPVLEVLEDSIAVGVAVGDTIKRVLHVVADEFGIDFPERHHDTIKLSPDAAVFAALGLAAIAEERLNESPASASVYKRQAFIFGEAALKFFPESDEATITADPEALLELREMMAEQRPDAMQALYIV